MWKIYYSFIQIIQILDITVEYDWNALFPNSIEFKLGRSIYQSLYSIIPPTSNEEIKLKVDDHPLLLDSE